MEAQAGLPRFSAPVHELMALCDFGGVSRERVELGLTRGLHRLWLVNIGGWQVMGIVPSVLFLQLFSKSKMSKNEILKKQKTTKSINCFEM